ncbi:hypothetical protein B0H34DRAFT_676381 [Crassisporium funariophilum]|nr:hypothetical protein B0H34DRAFT_676381 [Crassisporium funariophilum]
MTQLAHFTGKAVAQAKARPWPGASDGLGPGLGHDKQTAQCSTHNNAKAPTTAPKRKRQTKEQIAAGNAAAESEKRRLKELEEEKHNQVAQMDLEEDINRVEEDARAICKFSDLDHHSGLSEEEFGGYNNVVGSSSSETDLPVSKDCSANVFKALKKNHKALQKELDTLKGHIRGGKKNNVGRRKTKCVTFASGLCSDWDSQAGADKKAPKKHVKVISGGLGELDIDDNASTAKKATSLSNWQFTDGKTAKHNGLRQNQSIVNEIFCNTTYKVQANDAFYHIKRSHISAYAIKAVQHHISTISAHSSKNGVRDWICRAMRAHGPLFFKTPAPANSPTDRTNPKYKHPEGHLLSKFIINLAAPALCLQKGLVSDNGYPKAQTCCLCGNEIKEFSNNFWDSKIKVYHSSHCAIEETCWQEIFDEFGIKETLSSDNKNNADLLFLVEKHAFLLDHASPIKHWV